MDSRVTEAVKLIQGDLSRRANLDELARRVELSSSHLRSIFKSEIGMTPAQYIKKLRLLEAKRLLETTFLNVQQVMRCVGISDDSHFVRDFKKRYGMTPMHYRRKFRTEHRRERARPQRARLV